MRTSGATVVFSGMTVVVSLAGLFLLNSTVMRSMAIGAIVVVAIAILGAITLLPALIALLGRRADERGRDRQRHRRARAQGDAPQDSRRARRAGGRVLGAWSERVMRRPALSAILAGGRPAACSRSPRCR